MANNFEIILPATAFIPDSSAQLVAGDAEAQFDSHIDRPVLLFDDTAEEAAVSHEFEMPDAYTGAGTLKAKIFLATASDTTNDTAFDVFLEAKTPGADTFRMQLSNGWDAANAGTVSFSGTTVGDLLTIDITISNKQSVDGATDLASGDLVRIGIRRDTESANDRASGDVFVYAVTLYEVA